MYLKLAAQTEKILASFIPALFAQAKIAELLQSDITSLIREIIESPDFSDMQREAFFDYTAQQAKGTDVTAQLAQKYLKAQEHYVPKQQTLAHRVNIQAVSSVGQQLWKGREVYPLLQTLIISMPIFSPQQELYQNIFHPEGSCLAHTQQVGAAAVSFAASLVPPLIADQHYAPLLQTAAQDILFKLFPEDIARFRESLKEEIDGVSRAKLFVLASIFHDIGKPAMAHPTIKDNEYKIFKIGQAYYFDHKFSRHEAYGAELFLREAKGLGLTEKQTAYIYELIRCHKDITDAAKAGRKATQNGEETVLVLEKELKKYLADYRQKDIFYEAVLLFMADSMGKATIHEQALIFTPDLEELKEAFYTIIRLDRESQ